MTKWQEMSSAALRAAGPTKHDKAEALRAASREYRAMKGEGGGDHRENPGAPNWLLWAGLILGGIFVVSKVQAMNKPALAAGDPNAPPTNVTNNVPFMWSTNSSAK